jgi:hypothetical protein
MLSPVLGFVLIFTGGGSIAVVATGKLYLGAKLLKDGSEAELGWSGPGFAPGSQAIRLGQAHVSFATVLA